MSGNFGLIQPTWLFLVLPVLLWWIRRLKQPYVWPRLIPQLTIHYPLLAAISTNENEVVKKTFRGSRPDLLLAIAMCLMVLALAQPVRYTAKVTTGDNSEPVDLVLAVGTAISMSLRDYEIDGQAVDRMTLTRRLLDDFITDYSGNRIGLVISGSPPAMWLPLTTDKTVVTDAVSRIRTVLGGRLSDMGATLALIQNRFTGQGEKVVVLISDGGLQLGAISPEEAAKSLADSGFTLYVIAMGSDNDKIKPTEQGSLIYQPADLGMLSQVATLGGGQLFHVRDTQAFNDTLSTIEDKHRQPAPPSDTHQLVTAWFPLPLGLAMVLILLALLMPLQLSLKNEPE